MGQDQVIQILGFALALVIACSSLYAHLMNKIEKVREGAEARAQVLGTRIFELSTSSQDNYAALIREIGSVQEVKVSRAELDQHITRIENAMENLGERLDGAFRRA